MGRDPPIDFYSGMRFYMYMFLVTVANILVTTLLPVSRHPKFHPHKRYLSMHIVQIDFIGIGSRFGKPAILLIIPRLSCTLLLYSIEIVLHSNLACRLVIGIREASRSTVGKSDVFELSGTSGDNTVMFAHSNRDIGWADPESCPEPPKP